MVGVLFYQFAAAVGASAIDDNPLVVGESLRDDAVDGALQSFAVVKVDSNNGKLHLLCFFYLAGVQFRLLIVVDADEEQIAGELL